MGRYRSPRSPASDRWEAGSSAEQGGSGEERREGFVWNGRTAHPPKKQQACEPLETDSLRSENVNVK